ncbi:MAG: hypothetical protein JWM11_437, partial [Planctomycetaceae bacterium]|nr:hypothetical protein [Planctomycetaceae bacterium]
KGWEEFQARLLKQTPSASLVALSSGLDAVRPGVLKSWQPNSEPVNLLQLSHDGKLLYCGSGKDLTVLDLDTWQMKTRLERIGQAAQVVPHATGDLCLVRGDRIKSAMYDPNYDFDSLMIYRCEDGRRLLSVPGYWRMRMPGQSAGAALSSDGRSLVLSADSREEKAYLNVIELATGKIQRSIKPQTNASNFPVEIRTSHFFDEGRKLLTIANYDYSRIFSFPDGEEAEPPFSIPLRGNSLGPVAFSKDGKRLAVAGNYPSPPSRVPDAAEVTEIILWDMEKREAVTRRGFGREFVSSIAMLPDGRIVAGTNTGLLSIWPADQKLPVRRVQTDFGGIYHLIPWQKGTQLFMGDSGGHIRLVDLEKLAPPLEKMGAFAAPLQISADGLTEVLASSEKLYLRSRSDDKIQHTLPMTYVPGLGEIWSAGLETADKSVWLGGDGAVAHWVPGGTAPKVVTFKHEGRFSLLTPSAEAFAKKLLEENRARNYDPKRGPNPTTVRIPDGNSRVVVSPNGQYAAIWNPMRIGLFDPLTGELRHSLEPNAEPAEEAKPVDSSPRARMLQQRLSPGPKVIRFERDGVFISNNRLAIEYLQTDRKQKVFGCKVFDLESGKEVLDLPYGPQPHGSARIPSLQKIVVVNTPAGKTDRVLEIHDLITGKMESAPMPKEPIGQVLGATRDGKYLLSADNESGTVFVWDFPFRTLIRRFQLGEKSVQFQFDGIALTATQPQTKLSWTFRFQP